MKASRFQPEAMAQAYNEMERALQETNAARKKLQAVCTHLDEKGERAALPSIHYSQCNLCGEYL